MSRTTTSPLARLCTHTPRCASADSPGRESARVVAPHPEQGWSLLCNGVIAFDDGGDILPDGHGIAAPSYLPAATRTALAPAV